MIPLPYLDFWGKICNSSDNYILGGGCNQTKEINHSKSIPCYNKSWQARTLNEDIFFSLGDFSCEGVGILPLNSSKPSQALWKASL